DRIDGVRQTAIAPGVSARPGDGRPEPDRADSTIDDPRRARTIDADESRRAAQLRAVAEEVLDAAKVSGAFLAHRPDAHDASPGPWMRLPSVRGLTSVPAGNTESRCAATTTGASPSRSPGRRPMTLPTASVVTPVSPTSSKRLVR